MADAAADLGRTLQQSGEALAAARDLSIPSDVTQALEAPRIPGYVLTGLVGQGSFAQVWKAWQARTRKVVALKVFTHRAGVNWVFLQREMERLARIDKHPHIVSLLDADLGGETAWYATELLEGGSLERFVDPASPVPAERVATYLMELALALEFVHGKGIIHCDLKPGNVLLDESGRVRVADFGQARVIGDGSGGLGTLFYMAPEQAVLPREGEALIQPDVRWDVYALGATAYALLTGRAPHSDTLTEALGRTETVADRLEVYRMRVKAASLAGLQGRAGLDPELAAVVGKCLAASPDARYPHAGAVIADLRNRSQHRPVSPLAGRPVYRARKFVRRNLAALAVTAAAAVALAGTVVRIAAERARVTRQLAISYQLRAEQYADRGDEAAAALCFARLNQLAPSHLARSNALAYLHELEVPVSRVEVGSQPAAILASPDGGRVALGGTDGSLRMYAVESGALLFAVDAHKRGEWAGCLAFSADGTRVASGGGRGDGTARAWDAATGKPLCEPLPHGAKLLAVAFSPDGRRLFTLAEDLTFRRFTVGRGTRPAGSARLSIPGATAGVLGGGNTFLAVLPGGARAVAGFGKVAGVIDLRALRWQGAPLLLQGNVTSLALDAAGARLALGVTNETAVVLELGAGLAHPVVLPQDGQVTDVRFALDGRGLLVAGADGMARLWDSRGWKRVQSYRHGSWITRVEASPDGARVLTAGRDGILRQWNAATGQPVGHALRHPGSVVWFGQLPRGARLATYSDNKAINLWRASAGSALRSVIRPPSWGTTFALAPGAARAFIGMADRTGRLWNPVAGTPIGEAFPLPDDPAFSTFTPDGALLFVAGAKDRGGVFDGRTGVARDAWSKLPTGQSGITTIGLGPRDGLVLLCGVSLRWWDPAAARQAGDEVRVPSPVVALALAPDGSRAAVGLADGSARVYDWTSHRLLAEAKAHSELILALAFSADGKWAISGGNDHTARIWSVADGRPRGRPLPHEWGVPAVAFSADGLTVATGTYGFAVRMWDVESGQPVGKPFLSEGPVSDARFSADGTALVTVSSSTSLLQCWDVSWLAERPEAGVLMARVVAATGLELDGQGRLVPAAPPPARRGRT